MVLNEIVRVKLPGRPADGVLIHVVHEICEEQNWVSHGEIVGQDRTFQPIRLFKAKSVPIEA